MICTVCGQSYGLTHNCPGVSPLTEAELPVPAGLRFAPIEYFVMGWKIVFWDDRSIRGASRDPNALLYGFLFYLFGTGVPALLGILISISNNGGPLPTRTFLYLLALTPLGLAYDVARFGICHLIARYFLGGTGKFLPLLRSLFLGVSVVTWVAMVPGIGTLLAGIGAVVVIMVVFEELDHIDRLQAFVLSAGVNIIFWGVIFYLQPVTHALD
jgi:hypothetical protein